MRIAVLLIISCVTLSGCFGESKTYGVKNSEWSRLSESQKSEFERTYHEKQRLADQVKMNETLIKHNKKVAKVREENEKAQRRRLEEETDRLKAEIKQKDRYLQSQQDSVSKIEKYSESEIISINENI